MYPNPDTDPKIKGDKKWLLDYAKQAWKDGTAMTGIFYGAAEHYRTLKEYAMGKQNTAKYKKAYTDEFGKTFATDLDFTVRPVIAKYRDIPISKLQQRQYNITATPIDALAQDETTKYFADAKAKILAREAMMKVDPSLVESNPHFSKQAGEAEDLEELDMQKDYSYKHNMSMEGEMAWEMVADLNDFPEERNQTITNWYDFGVAGYKDWLDDQNNPNLREVKVENIITSYCRRPDFKDATHMGEVIEVNLTELEATFTADEIKMIRESNPGQNAYKPDAVTMNKDKSKVHVLDLELISTDELVFEQRVNKKGNLVFGMKPYSLKDKKNKVMIEGEETSKFSSRKVEIVYRVKWVIGTDLVYEYGKATNQKRDKSMPYKACLSYHMYAYNFYQMTAVGFMERLIPTLDEYQETIIKIRHFKNKWIPYLIEIDMDALEGVALGKGGANMKPMELLDMAMQTHVMLVRKTQAGGNNINYKAVDVQTTTMANEFAMLVSDLARLDNELTKLSGLNELTDGSTPNAKTLVPVANLANEATNNSQFPIIRADINCNQRLAKGVIQRVQLAIKSGKQIAGIVHALGDGTAKFFKMSPDFPMYEIGIMVEDRPTDAQWQMLIQDLNLKDAQGQIDPDVKVIIRNCRSLKQAEQILAYKIKKKREKDQQMAMQNAQQTGQIQIQSAQEAEKAKQGTLTLEYQLRDALETKLKQMDLDGIRMKIEGAASAQQATGGLKLADTMMQHDHENRQTRTEQGLPNPEPQPIPTEIPSQEPEMMAEQPMQ